MAWGPGTGRNPPPSERSRRPAPLRAAAPRDAVHLALRQVQTQRAHQTSHLTHRHRAPPRVHRAVARRVLALRAELRKRERITRRLGPAGARALPAKRDPAARRRFVFENVFVVFVVFENVIVDASSPSRLAAAASTRHTEMTDPRSSPSPSPTPPPPSVNTRAEASPRALSPYAGVAVDHHLGHDERKHRPGVRDDAHRLGGVAVRGKAPDAGDVARARVREAVSLFPEGRQERHRRVPVRGAHFTPTHVSVSQSTRRSFRWSSATSSVGSCGSSESDSDSEPEPDSEPTSDVRDARDGEPSRDGLDRLDPRVSRRVF